MLLEEAVEASRGPAEAVLSMGMVSLTLSA